MLLAPALLESITRGILTEAFATTTKTPLRNYVSLWMDGGAERVWFDGILSPNGASDSLGAGAGIFNFLSWSPDKDLPDFIYKTTATAVNGKFYLPYLWESLLPFDSGTMPMKALASNLAIIRGVQTGLTFDAHGQNKGQQLSPFPGESILGEIADAQSEALVSGIVTDQGFTSKKGKNSSTMNAGDGPRALFTPILLQQWWDTPMNNSASARMGLAAMDGVVTSFINSLADQMPKRKAPIIQLLMDNRKKAVELMIKGFDGIDSDYQNTLDGYFQLIASVMDPDPSRILVGLDDRPIKGHDQRLRLWTDLPVYYDSRSLVDGFRTASCWGMAHAFTKAEIFLKYKITQCLNLNLGSIGRISHQYTGDPNNPAHVSNFGFDCHYTGDLFRALAFSRYYQSLAACLLRFRSKLTALPGKTEANLWSETLVNLRSEFNRGYRDLGSDHNIEACVETFFSGAIQDGPIVAGNIYISDKLPTLGNSAPVQAAGAAGNECLSSKYTYSTLGALMGYEPSRNHKPVLVPSGNKIISNIEPPKNITRTS